MKKRLIDANRIVEVAERAYNAWNLAMATADGKREINLVYKRQELCKAVKAVADDCPTVDAVEAAQRWMEGQAHDNHLHFSDLLPGGICDPAGGAFPEETPPAAQLSAHAAR